MGLPVAQKGEAFSAGLFKESLLPDTVLYCPLDNDLGFAQAHRSPGLEISKGSLGIA